MTETATLRPPAAIATQLIDQLVAALINVRIHAATHPRVSSSLGAVQQHLRELADLWREDPVRIGTADGLLFFQRRPLLGSSMGSSRLIEALQRFGAGGIEMSAAADREALAGLVGELGSRQPAGTGWKAVNQRFAERRLRHVALLPPYATPSAAGNATDTDDQATRLRIAIASFQGVIDLLQDVTVSVCRGGQIDFGAVEAQAGKVFDQLRLDDGPMLNLTRRGQYDAFTFGHSARTTVLTLSLARSLTDDRDLLTRIGVATLLHDVGKALVPFELLHAQRTLTSEELAEVHRHPQLGAEILLDHRGCDPLAVAAAFGHHHAADNGYPFTLHDHPTSLVTEMVKICDVYEALTAARPHRLPMSPVRAYRVMLGMGNRFDRGLLRRFIDQNGIYPVGQRVLLQNGEQAIVRAQSSVPTAPVVDLLTDEHGVPLDPQQQPRVDLAADAGGALRLIIGELPAPDAFADEAVRPLATTGEARQGGGGTDDAAPGAPDQLLC